MDCLAIELLIHRMQSFGMRGDVMCKETRECAECRIGSSSRMALLINASPSGRTV